MQYVDFTQLSFHEGLKTAKDLLSSLLSEIQESSHKPANPAAPVSSQKHFSLSKNEPKTSPTRREFVPSNLQSLSKGRTRILCKRMAIGGGIFLIAGIIVATLILKPTFLAAPPAPTSTNVPTESPTGTYMPVPTITPVASVLKVPISFTENFDSRSEWDTNWSLQLRHGSTRKYQSFNYVIANGDMAVDLSYQFVWAYFLYQPATSGNIELEAVVADLNSVDTFGLVCQFGSQGWYEFDINGGGNFAVRYVDSMESDQDADGFLIHYGTIPNFKNSIVSVRENSIRAICNGNHLSLFVNDQLVMDKLSNKFVLQEGQLGMSIRSYDRYPSRFTLKSIKVREPED
jgi:hypothetical protein